MAKTEDAPQAEFNQRIVEVLEQLADNAPIQEIGYGHPKFQERLRAEGFFTEFARPVYQNGIEAQARGLRPETLEHAPQLRPGSFLGGKVHVERSQTGKVNLVYATSKIEDRMRFESLVAPRGDGWTGFDELIDKIWAEQHAPVPA